MGNGGSLMSVKSTSKPTATIESKQYRMINHYYNYPGIVKWEPITITFVDTKMWGADISYDLFEAAINRAQETANNLDTNDFGEKQAAFNKERVAIEDRFGRSANDIPVGDPVLRMTSHTLWEMLIASGYTPPSIATSEIASGRATSISSPEKAAMMDLSFGKSLNIHQLHPDGASELGVIKSVETWELHNPIITKISWGELDYADDGLVEYTLDITYDWAIHYPKNPNSKEISDAVTIGGTTIPG